MFESMRGKKKPDLLNLDWENVRALLASYDPKEEVFYMITVNKGKDDEHRTKFMTWQETMELVMFALEKKKLRVTA